MLTRAAILVGVAISRWATVLEAAVYNAAGVKKAADAVRELLHEKFFATSALIQGPLAADLAPGASGEALLAGC